MGKLLSIFLLVFTNFCAAQPFSFRHYTSEHGFPESAVNALLEDKRRVLWIGTNSGLFAFDGYTFHAYPASGPDEKVLSLFEDRDGGIWVGTENGVYVFNGRHFLRQPFLRDDAIVGFTQTENGDIVICSRTHGVVRYNGVTLASSGQGIPRGTTFHTIIAPDAQNILAGSGNGLYRYAGSEVILTGQDQGLPGKGVLSFAIRPDNRIWIGTTGGLCLYDRGMTSRVTGFPGTTGRKISAIATGTDSSLWLATEQGILWTDGKRAVTYDVYPGQEKVPATCLLMDKSGNLWVGSGRGLARMEKERFKHYTSNDQLGRHIFSVAEAINGNLLCGTSLGGTTVFDGVNFTLLDKRGGFTSSVVEVFCYAPDSSLWVGTRDDGLFIFRRGDALHYTKEDGLSSNNISGIAFSQNGRAWLSWEGGLMIPHFDGDTLTSVREMRANTGTQIQTILPVDDRLWVGTSHGLWLAVIDQDSVNFSSPQNATGLTGAVIYCLRRHNGLLFIGTSRGLAVMDDRQIRMFTRSDGLTSNRIYSLTVDHDDNWWAGTDRGVDAITFQEDNAGIQVSHFGHPEGFRGGEVFRRASCTDRNGTVWFGTINGLVGYHPGDDHAAATAPVIHLTGMKLFFERIEKTPYTDSVSAWYPLPVDLTLPYDQNNITFSFAGIDHRNPDMVRYRWKLDGFSKEWSPLLKEREAVFSNLPPGRYTFRVTAANERSAQEAAYSFAIRAPWWDWWWTRASLAILVVSVVAVTFAARLRRIEARNRVHRERLVLENSVLRLEQEASRLQMNPHFLFNCLNSIQGLIASGDAIQAKRYLGKFARLMRLILEHAREEFIPLADEIGLLENYLQLEQLSTGKAFTFSVICDPSVDPDAIELPPMMIQPFVENAIIHGIRKKIGEGIISVYFYRKEDVLVCEVTDNGIGREEAKRINEQSRRQHRSAAIGITQQRLAQYGRLRQQNAGIEFVDLYDNGMAAGTKVVIKTPTGIK